MSGPHSWTVLSSWAKVGTSAPGRLPPLRVRQLSTRSGRSPFNLNNDEIRVDLKTFVLRGIVVQTQSEPVLKSDFHGLRVDHGVSIDRRIQEFLEGASSPVSLLILRGN